MAAWTPAACSCSSSCPGSARCGRSPTTHGLTTSTVSQQIAALAREVGAAAGRAGRPAGPADPGRAAAGRPRGRRSWPRSRPPALDLDPGAEPAGQVRVAAFATADPRARCCRSCGALRASRTPTCGCVIHEHEPSEALDAAGRRRRRPGADLRLQPGAPLASADRSRSRPAVVDGVGPGGAGPGQPGRGDSLAVFDRFRDQDWIVNSRNTADEDAVRTVALAGRLPAPDHAPRRQPRPRAGPDRRRSRRRPAAGGPAARARGRRCGR